MRGPATRQIERVHRMYDAGNLQSARVSSGCPNEAVVDRPGEGLLAGDGGQLQCVFARNEVNYT